MNWWERFKKRIILPRKGQPPPPDAKELLLARIKQQLDAKLPPAIKVGPEIYTQHPMLRQLDMRIAAAVAPKINAAKISVKQPEGKMGIAVMLIGILAQVADGVLNSATKLKWPQEIIDSLVAASEAISKAHTQAVTKAGLETGRQ